MQAVSLTPQTASALMMTPKGSSKRSAGPKKWALSRSKKAQQEQEALEKERAAKLAQKAEETRRLSIAVNDRIRERRLSHELAQDLEEEESKKDSRCRSLLASGLVSSQDVESINRHVRKREEQRARRNSTEGDAATVTSAAAEAACENIDAAAQVACENIESTATSAAPRKKPSARERMAQMQREADERKRIAQGLNGNQEETKEGDVPKRKPNAQQIGTARAAAKVAGGVFYTIEEHVRAWHGSDRTL